MDSLTMSHERLRDVLAEKIGLVNCALHKISDPGSSQSRVYIYKANDEKLIAVKTSRADLPQRVKLLDEANNREHILPHLKDNVADVYWAGEVDNHAIMIYESIGTETLHHEIKNGNISQTELASIWDDVLGKITDMWVATQIPTTAATVFPRDYDARYERIVAGIKQTQPAGLPKPLDAYLDYPLVINGVTYPALRQTLDGLKLYTPPSVTVTCHGDPQPSNIIIDPATGKWQLIDWEWSAPGHDWRMMSAHLLGWWLSRTVTFQEKPLIGLDKRALQITYQVLTSPQNKIYQDKVINILNSKMKLMSNQADMQSFRHFLVLLLLGEVRFTPLWRREQHMPYLLALATIIMYSDFPNTDITL